MAWKFPTVSTNSSTNLSTTDSLFVAKPIVVGNVIASGTNQQAIIAGTVAGFNDGIFFVGLGHSIKIDPSGDVRGFSGTGVGFLGGNGTLANKGYIFGGTYGGVYISGGDATTSVKVNNAGTIESSTAGILRYSDVQAISITNSGTIQGDQFSFKQSIATDDARDLIVNNGTMIGKIDFGGGNDTYDGRLGVITGDILGGAGGDKLYSGIGNNRLYGEDGDDTLMGGVGADVLNGGAGIDRASYSSATKAVTVSLAKPSINTGDAAGDTYKAIENVTGSSFNDLLVGNSVSNAINGGSGNDTINGLAGKDTLTGGAGRDTFVFDTALNVTTNVDVITDFSVADDTIRLENSVFTALTTTGVLASATFAKNGTGNAGDSSDRIIYETDTGKLYYDRDGTAAAYDSVHFATLKPGLAITNADFIIA